MSPEFTNYRTHVEAIVTAAVSAADPSALVKRHLSVEESQLKTGGTSFDLRHGKVYLIAVGKAAAAMSMAALEVLGTSVVQALVVTKRVSDGNDISSVIAGDHVSPPVMLIESGHPVSDQESIRAARQAEELLTSTTENDLVLFLISGGASALLTDPVIPLSDWQALTAALIESGCTINELNLVRRGLDRVKGGGLAMMASPARCVSLILSDVVGNPLPDIGSGPTVPVSKAPSQVMDILQRYDLSSRLSSAASERISRALDETAVQSPASVPAVENIVIGDVSTAAQAALTRAVQMGFLSQVLTCRLQGEAREVGRVVSAIAKDLPSGRCLILGGETTVTVQGSGKGGRNQELALAVSVELEGWPGVAVAAFSTDGEDSTTGYAGAVVTGLTVGAGRRHGLEAIQYLNNNDSYTYFNELDSLLKKDASRYALPSHLICTGPTGTNVNDLLVVLTYGPNGFGNDSP